jgi:hypothetical protein
MFLLIEKLNSLRNKLAHNLNPVDLEKKVQDLLSLYLSELNNPKVRDEHKQQPVPDQLRSCVAFLLGFLNSFLEQSKLAAHVRDCVRAVDTEMHQKSGT